MLWIKWTFDIICHRGIEWGGIAHFYIFSNETRYLKIKYSDGNNYNMLIILQVTTIFHELYYKLIWKNTCIAKLDYFIQYSYKG